MEQIKFREIKQNNKKEGVQLSDRSILQTHFFMGIIGKPGSGKSRLVEELVMNEKCYYKKFDKIVFLSPSKIAEELDMILDDN